MHRLFRSGLLCLAITTAFSSSAEITHQIPDTENASRFFSGAQTGIDLFSLPLSGNSRSWQISEPDTNELAATMRDILLPKGSWIEVSDASGKLLEIYNDKTLYDGSKPQIITPPVEGGKITIKVVTPDEFYQDGSLIVSEHRYVKRSARAIFGGNQMKQAACYQTINPTFFMKSHAVVKANGASGWNVAGGPYVITNHHVAGDVGNKIHSLNYNYQYPACDQTTPLNVLSIKTEGVVVAGKGGTQDVAVYKVDPLAYKEAGIKQIFGTLAINSETPKAELINNLPVYIAQHPWGDYKRISSQDDDRGPCHTLAGSDNNTLAYNCDTDGGSSGSPVLSQSDNRVVALHRAATGSYNIGVMGSYLYSFIKELIPSSNQAEAATPGEGKVMVKALNFFPFMPQPLIDLQVDGAITLKSLYENRLEDDRSNTLFKAKARVPGGDIIDVNVRFSLTTPCGETNFTEAEQCSLPGKRFLNSWILGQDNPELHTFSGWITLQISDRQGQRLRNLILPVNYVAYDPFTSPFASGSEVREYWLTEGKTLTTEQISFTTNFGFVAVYSGQGPMSTMQGGTGYTTLKVQVRHEEDGQVHIMNLRGNRKTVCSPSLRPINSVTGCGDKKPASLVVSYHDEDNLTLPAGVYTGILPVMAKRDNTDVAPILIHLNIKK